MAAVEAVASAGDFPPIREVWNGINETWGVLRRGGPVKRPRKLERAQVGWPRPLRELKDLLYEAYLDSGCAESG
ncbi:hypothetical protein [Kribbella solani]|uniref:hypothetical protein n=1 Tax=Kribbella solani TaxID=236067 RepID=UPI0029B85111|nr:hypothetical protein [Kribbella solani]MDX2969005.1 hypothetical protein [Kribbella solani]